MSKLADLLDFGPITNIDSLYEHYYQTAAQLFYGHEIKTEKDDRYFITDLELYLYNPEFFKDPFMGARHHTQLTNGRFYIHRNDKKNTIALMLSSTTSSTFKRKTLQGLGRIVATICNTMFSSTS